MTEYTEIEIDERLYNLLRDYWEKDNRKMSFDEFVNYLLKIGLEYD